MAQEFFPLKNTIRILTAAVSLIIADYTKAQDLKAEKIQFQWNGWGVKINDLAFADTVPATSYSTKTADNDSEFVYMKFTVTNSSHEGQSFIPQNDLKIIIGDNAFDAADVGGLEY